jgi:hypothetical protein
MSKKQEASEEADRGTQTAIRACSGEGEPTLVSPAPHRAPDVASTTQIVPVSEPATSNRQTPRPSDASGSSGDMTDPATDVRFDGNGERVGDDVEGETFRTVFGSLLGVYTWECQRVPSDDEIQVVMEHRVQTDCARLNHRPKRTRLAGWHGGWTTEGVGIFAADIWGMSRNGPARHLGRLSVIVRTPKDTGLSASQGIAC